ncbi:hemerythrin domain-containing protein [Nocardia amamiensis]|uniref:hemerythrin domain-containing protein n=1 Tax=Nocardia TaxID=1817 RepID=UPI00340AB064
MDAMTFLRNDHESVLGMIESLERGRGDGAAEVRARSDLATSLVIASSQHEAVEEQFFWPAVRRALVPDGDKLADQAIEQEDMAKGLLREIERSEAGSREFERALTAFITAIREHIEFEQSQVWPRFRDAASRDTLEELGEKMASAKKMAPTRPHPDTPSRAGAQKSLGLVGAIVDKARDMLTGRRSHQPPQPPPT